LTADWPRASLPSEKKGRLFFLCFIDLQEMKTATANEVEKARKEAALKKGLSD